MISNVLKGQMVTSFNDWIYDESRKAGDSGMVESTYGQHIIYFVGNGDPAWKAQTKSTLTSNAFQELITEDQDKYPITFDTESFYKLSGKTAYSKVSPVTSAAETDGADVVPADTEGADVAADTGAAVVADDTAPAVIATEDTGA